MEGTPHELEVHALTEWYSPSFSSPTKQMINGDPDKAPLVPLPTLRAGGNADEVKCLQRCLVVLNYLSAGDVDGIYGNKTQTEVEALQADNAVTTPNRGVYDYATYRALCKAMVNSRAWETVRMWKSSLATYCGLHGVPLHLAMSVMQLESNGANLSPNLDGAVGPMQVTSSYDGLARSLGLNRSNADDNVRLGVAALAQCCKDSRNIWGWDGAVRAYLSGKPNPSDVTDRFGTSANYYSTKTSRYWDQLDEAFEPTKRRRDITACGNGK